MKCKNCGHDAKIVKGICSICEVFVGENKTALDIAGEQAKADKKAAKKPKKGGKKK